MKPLPTQFRKDGFDHEVIRREGMVALIKKTKTGYSSFEVIRIQSHDGYEMMGVVVPPAEHMPRSEDWGTHGFTFPGDSRVKADAKFMELVRADATPKVIKTKIKLILKK